MRDGLGTEHSFDLRGFRCPLPVLKTAKRLQPLPAGTRVEVLADDPLAKLDLPHFCLEKGHRLVEQDERDGTLRFVIEKGG